MIQVLLSGSCLIPQEIPVNKQDCLALGTFRNPLGMHLSTAVHGKGRQNSLRESGIAIRLNHNHEAPTEIFLD